MHLNPISGVFPTMQMWDRAGKNVPQSDSQHQRQERKLFQIKGAVEAESERHSTRSDFIPNTCDPVMQRQIASLLRVVTEQRDAEQSPEVLLPSLRQEMNMFCVDVMGTFLWRLFLTKTRSRDMNKTVKHKEKRTFSHSHSVRYTPGNRIKLNV